MFAKLLIILAAAFYTNGTPLKTSKVLEYDPKYFTSVAPHIVGGEDAPEGYGRGMVALVTGYLWPMLVCGASIVTQRHVLTAAHCVDSFISWNDETKLLPSYRGIIGTNKWSKETKKIYFSSFVMHEKWNRDEIKYDICVLRVSEEIRTSEDVTIVPLNYDWVDGGVRSYVTGWGLLEAWGAEPARLQLLYVSTLSAQQCEAGMREAAQELGPAPPVRADIELCTLHSPRHGMCNGDSGSPLITEDTQVQIGIVSWGYPCARGVPDVFVRVSGFRDWLLPILGENVVEES